MFPHENNKSQEIVRSRWNLQARLLILKLDLLLKNCKTSMTVEVNFIVEVHFYYHWQHLNLNDDTMSWQVLRFRWTMHNSLWLLSLSVYSEIWQSPISSWQGSAYLPMWLAVPDPYTYLQNKTRTEAHLFVIMFLSKQLIEAMWENMESIIPPVINSCLTKVTRTCHCSLTRPVWFSQWFFFSVLKGQFISES